MISDENIKTCLNYDTKLFNIRKHIFNVHNGKPFKFDGIMVEAMKPDILTVVNSYKPGMLIDTEFDFTSLTLKDLIKGYYDCMSIQSEIKNPIDSEKIFTSTKWSGGLFDAMKPKINFKVGFFQTMARVNSMIYELLFSFGFGLQSSYRLEQKLIQIYLETREFKKPFLPTIEQLSVNDTLYIVNFVHGGVNIKNENGLVYDVPQTIDIPSTMNFYRIMASDYGAISCTAAHETENYLTEINKFLKIKRKNTHRNNIKTIENIISKCLRKTMGHMKTRKEYGIKTSEKEKKRYDLSKAHVHFFKESKMIFKQHYVYLFRDDDIDSVYVANPQMDVNLMDYIDIKIDRFGIITFNLADIINLIQSIRYVLFIDLSCSSTTRNTTNNEIARFKSLAQRTEGSSITNRMAIHLNTSPYNESPTQTKHLSLNRSRSSVRRRSKRSIHSGRRAHSLGRSFGKSRRYEYLTESTTAAGLPRMMYI